MKRDASFQGSPSQFKTNLTQLEVQMSEEPDPIREPTLREFLSDPTAAADELINVELERLVSRIKAAVVESLRPELQRIVATIKTHRPDAERGRTVKDAAQKGGEGRCHPTRDRWQSLAEEYWLKYPRASKVAAALHVCVALGLSARSAQSVRKAILKPET